MQIAADKAVLIHYTLTDNNGTTVDSSEGRPPLAYLHGANNIIPGLEKELLGKVAGDKLEVSIPPAEGYGERDDTLIAQVPRDRFESDAEIVPGMFFQTASPDGHAQMVVVKEVTETEVTIDANHPLAGETLNFSVEVMEVRDATAEELQHGHVHAPGGHDHG